MTTGRLSVAAATLACLVILGGLGWALHYRASVARSQTRYEATVLATVAVNARRNCLAIEKLKSYTEGAIRRAQKTLPLLVYYRQHPSELVNQLADLQVIEKQFAPRACPPLLPPP